MVWPVAAKTLPVEDLIQRRMSSRRTYREPELARKPNKKTTTATRRVDVLRGHISEIEARQDRLITELEATDAGRPRLPRAATAPLRHPRRRTSQGGDRSAHLRASVWDFIVYGRSFDAVPAVP